MASLAERGSLSASNSSTESISHHDLALIQFETNIAAVIVRASIPRNNSLRRFFRPIVGWKTPVKTGVFLLEKPR
jgi:hypothetical protein